MTATLLLPFGVAAGDELVPPAVDGTSRPVSLSCQFYGVKEDTVHVRKEKQIISLQSHFKIIIPMHAYVMEIITPLIQYYYFIMTVPTEHAP